MQDGAAQDEDLDESREGAFSPERVMLHSKERVINTLKERLRNMQHEVDQREVDSEQKITQLQKQLDAAQILNKTNSNKLKLLDSHEETSKVNEKTIRDTELTLERYQQMAEHECTLKEKFESIWSRKKKLCATRR